jgi:hypothetical protein
MFRHFREHVYRCSGSYIQSCVDICILGISAMQTKKFSLAFAIGFLTMATLVTGSGRVAWVDCDNRDAVEFPFVLDEITQLGKGPSTHFGSLLPLEPGPVTNPFEILKGDSSTGVFGENNERLADNVIRVKSEASFVLADAFHCSASVLSGPPFVTARHLAAQHTPDTMELLSNVFDVTSVNCLPVACGDEFGYAKIDTDERLDFNRSGFGKIHGAEQVEFPAAIDQVALPFDPVEPLALIFAVDHWDDLPSFKCKKADGGGSAKGHQALIVGHRAMGLEDRASGLIPLETFDGLANGSDSHLARQSEPIAQFPIAAGVDARLTKHTCVKSNTGSTRSSRVERFHRSEQHPFLFDVRQDLELQSQLHPRSLGYYLSQVNKSDLRVGVSTREF